MLIEEKIHEGFYLANKVGQNGYWMMK